jgi:hypothetical protein
MHMRARGAIVKELRAHVRAGASRVRAGKGRYRREKEDGCKCKNELAFHGDSDQRSYIHLTSQEWSRIHKLYMRGWGCARD